MSVTFYQSLDKYPKRSTQDAVVTVGTFDGIHRGHQEIFRRVKISSQERNERAVLLTFDPHPRVILTPDNFPMLLTSVEEKQRFVPNFFDGDVITLESTERLMSMSAEGFVQNILVEHIGASKLIVGYDHTFGHNREGGIPAMKLLGTQLGFDVEVVDPVFASGSPVSSTRIREALMQGSYEDALELLGHDYAIFGTVERGIGLGQKLGFPTANVKYSERKLLPPEGVYACWVEVNGREYNGMLFVGQNHFNPVQRVTVEANIFDFDNDIYGKEIVINPTFYIRENRRFESQDALVEQIKNDKNIVTDNSQKRGAKQWQ